MQFESELENRIMLVNRHGENETTNLDMISISTGGAMLPHVVKYTMSMSIASLFSCLQVSEDMQISKQLKQL